MDQNPLNGSKKFGMVICYKINNIIDSAVIEEIGSRKNVPTCHVQDSADLCGCSERALIVCDLTKMTSSELVSIVAFSKVRKWQILGSYPHVLKEVGENAVSEGVNYVVPRSAFKRKLEQLLTN